MGSSYLTSPLTLIINTIFDLYVLLVLLRFMLQMLRADFYNPVSQFIVRLTSPPLKILRRTIFLIAIIIQVILSWVNPGHYNPVVGLVNTLAAPALRPVKKIVPAIGGLDLSPIIATLMIYVAKMLIIPPIIYLGSQF